MIQVKYVHPARLLNKKQVDILTSKYIPVVELSALREVVEKAAEKWPICPTDDPQAFALDLLQRQHAAVVRKVKAMQKHGDPHSMVNSATISRFCKDLLAWLDERGR